MSLIQKNKSRAKNTSYYKKLNSIDYLNQRKRINSPQYLYSMRTFGIDENNLYYIKKSDIINNNPKIRNQSKQFQDAYYYYKEINRNNLIEKSRNEFFKQDINSNTTYIPYNRYYTPNNSYINYNYIPNHRLKRNNTIKPRKSLTDFWKLRYDIDKENEQIYYLKKQNISQIKLLIDETLKLRKKSKFPNHKKYLIKKEKKNEKHRLYLLEKEKRNITQEKINNILKKIEQKKNEEIFNKECKLQKEIEQIKEEKKLQKQNEIFQKQKKWEIKNYEHQIKVENIYKKKHEIAVNEFLSILKKGLERYEKIDQRKNIKNRNYQIKNEERKINYDNYKINKNVSEKKLRKKYEKKQKNISEFYYIQKEIKKNKIQIRKKELEEKMKNNIYIRLLNKSMEKQRRNKLLDLFEKNEKKVEKRKILNIKKNEEYKLNNLLHSDEIYDNYIRNINILNNKNMKKLQKMRNKDYEINTKILQRQNSAKNRIARYDKIKFNKDLMMQNVKDILEDRNNIYYKPEDIYKKVFTNQEIKSFLNE